MTTKEKFGFATILNAALCVLLFLMVARNARAEAPTLSTIIDFSEYFAKKYDLSYYDGNAWIPLRNSATTVSSRPRFSFEQSPPHVSSYKYAIYVKEKNNTNADFYLFISTNKDPCIVQMARSGNLAGEVLGVVYNVTTQYTDLSIGHVFNSNVSTSYSVCSRDNTLAVRFFDPLTSGVPIAIGSYANMNERISETYIFLNTEGILYPR